MNTYQFESVVEDKGIIVLPEQMKPLRKHRVRLILIDMDTFSPEPVQQLTQVTQKYRAGTDEDELFIDERKRKLLSLCGRWEDNRSSEEIIEDIHNSRRDSHRLENGL